MAKDEVALRLFLIAVVGLAWFVSGQIGYIRAHDLTVVRVGIPFYEGHPYFGKCARIVASDKTAFEACATDSF